ncbi:MAG: hypothetical protein FGM34_10370 [Solirubrobacteraceae bacterium]|nr:hypothetical protein [Solirubrobacteraceae bacterium]
MASCPSARACSATSAIVRASATGATRPASDRCGRSARGPLPRGHGPGHRGPRGGRGSSAGRPRSRRS